MSKFTRIRWHWAGLAAALLIAGGFTAMDVVPAASQDANLRSWRVETSDALMDPWSGLWDNVKPMSVTLTGQNATKPLGGGEVAMIKARSLHDSSKLYVVIEWRDKTVDDTVNGHTVFTDSAAIEFPTTAAVAIPSFCMGDATGTVNIWHWKAAWQRDMDRGFTSIADRYPDGVYNQPADDLFYPARYVGNSIAATEHSTPVENLVAASFGTLTTADVQDVNGRGEWKDGRWRVVFARDLAAGPDFPTILEGDSTNVAFAVWDGSKGNRDGIKSVSQFMNLSVTATALPDADGGFPLWGWGILGAILLAAAAGLAGVYFKGGAQG